MTRIEYTCLADEMRLRFSFDLEKINVTVYVYFIYRIRTKFIYVTCLLDMLNKFFFLIENLLWMKITLSPAWVPQNVCVWFCWASYHLSQWVARGIWGWRNCEHCRWCVRLALPDVSGAPLVTVTVPSTSHISKWPLSGKRRPPPPVENH